jgi:hypothetical protein
VRLDMGMDEHDMEGMGHGGRIARYGETRSPVSAS